MFLSGFEPEKGFDPQQKGGWNTPVRKANFARAKRRPRINLCKTTPGFADLSTGGELAGRFLSFFLQTLCFTVIIHYMKIDIDKLPGTDFQRDVWRALMQIPYGQTRTYKQLATMACHPSAVRAVANAVGANPCAPDIPCHRVVRSDGGIGGYSAPGGIARKLELLRDEKKDL
jgi:methylated-DNA-[protein]-cysteine S-methyltransferase